jgi:hypothetical protein
MRACVKSLEKQIVVYGGSTMTKVAGVGMVKLAKSRQSHELCDKFVALGFSNLQLSFTLMIRVHQQEYILQVM